MKRELKIKRVYEPHEKADGFRILVDRLWPRGISKEQSAVDAWVKNIAPSNELRCWFAHDPKRWDEFKIRYLKELKSNTGAQHTLKQYINNNHIVTLLYASKDSDHNNALVLKQFLLR